MTITRACARALVPALFSVAAACGGGRSASSPPADATAPTLNVVRVVQQPVNVTLSMPGELDAYESVAVYSKVTGFVKTIRVDRGSHVRAGELLAQLEAPELLAQRAEAQSKVQAAEAQLAAVRSKADGDASTYDRLTAASATPGVVAGNDLVLAQKSVEADRNQVAAAEQNAEAARQAVRAVSQIEGYLRVTAPFSGIVTERNVHPGALVGPNSGATAAPPIVRLVQSDRLRLVVPVPEAYVAGVQEGAPISFTVPAYPGRVFSGQVARIAHAVDVKTRTMAVELDVVNGDGALAPGSFCEVQWPVHRPAPSLFVPAASVASTTDRTFVVRVRNGRTEWVDVKTGLASGPLTEVFGDLQPGDIVAARGTDELRPGTQVRAQEAAQQKPAASLQMGGAKSVTRFFVTSRGVGRGGDLGGLAGADAHCQSLAAAEGSGDHTWRAYLSTSADTRAPAVNARDRIGTGPWYNALGDRIATDLQDLHSDANMIDADNALTEKGDAIDATLHDILTGSRPDGTAFPASDDLTCGNWTSNGPGRAQVGHSDRKGREAGASSWNSAHPSRGCSQAALRATQGAGLFYCFAAD